MRVTKYSTRQSGEGKWPILIKEQTANYPGYQKLDTPSAIAKVVCDLYELDKRTEEYIYVVCFDENLGLKGIFEVGHGSINACILDKRQLFADVLLTGASRFVLVHNHPSGSTKPSKEDINVAKELTAGAKLLNLTFLDSIIVANGSRHFSMQTENIM